MKDYGLRAKSIVLGGGLETMGFHYVLLEDALDALTQAEAAQPPTKIGVLAADVGDYTAYVAYFDDHERLQVAVDKLNATRLDTDSMDPAGAEMRIEKLLSVPDVIDDDFLDLLAGYLSDAGREIERADDVRERLEQKAADEAEEEEPEPVIPSPGQEEIGL